MYYIISVDSSYWRNIISIYRLYSMAFAKIVEKTQSIKNSKISISKADMNKKLTRSYNLLLHKSQFFTFVSVAVNICRGFRRKSRYLK